MSSRTVRTPTGGKLEVVSDDDWIAASDKATIASLKQWNGGTKRLVIADLWNRGPVTDEKSGRATARLWDRMGEHYGDEVDTQPTSFNGLHRDNPLMFKRTTSGKRTYHIELSALPETWYIKLQHDENERAKAERARQRAIDKQAEKEAKQAAEFAAAEADRVEAIAAEERAGLTVPLADAQIVTEPTATAEDDDRARDEEFDRMIQGIELDAPTVYEIGPPLELSIASQVAMSLLTTVVEIISAGSSDAVDERVRQLTADMADISSKLGQRLEDNDRLRRQLRTAGDEIVALRHERDGLRSRLRATEANLTAALKGDAVIAINGEIQRRVDAIMRSTPKGKGDD